MTRIRTTRAGRLLAMPLAAALVAACGDDSSADGRVCEAVDDLNDTMSAGVSEGDATTAVNDKVAVLVDRAAVADDTTLRDAGGDLEAASTDPALSDEWGPALARLMDRCDEL